MGKTRLALQAAATLADRLRDGATFVALSTVDAPERVATAIVDGILAYYGQDEGTRAIMMQIESFKDPAAFLANLHGSYEGQPASS